MLPDHFSAAERPVRQALADHAGKARHWHLADLFADDAGAVDFFRVAGRVDDRPMAVQELNGRFAFIRDPDRVEEEPSTSGRVAMCLGKVRRHRHANAVGQSFGSGLEKVGFAHAMHTSIRTSRRMRRMIGTKK